MVKKKFLIVPLMVLILSVNSIAYAAPSASNAGNVQWNDLEKQIDELEQKMEEIDGNIEEYMAQIEELTAQIKISEEKIKEAEAELEAVKKEAESSRELFRKRARVLYENGVDSYLNILMESKSFSDFITGISTVKTIIEYDKKIINGFNEKELQISSTRDVLIEENNKLLAMKVDIENKLSAINGLKESQKSLLRDLKAKQAALTPPSSSPSLPSRGETDLGTSNNAVIAYARQFLGVPYVYGGSTPRGFDCSGFTKYVFAHFGVSLNRTARAQSAQGTSVSFNNLQPGDLVFMGRPIHHVGIYIGNGKYIHSPHTGDVVKISKLTLGYFTLGKRVR